MNSTYGSSASTASDEEVGTVNNQFKSILLRYFLYELMFFIQEYFVQQGVAIKSLSKLHKGSKRHKNAETHYTGILKIMKYVRFHC